MILQNIYLHDINLTLYASNKVSNNRIEFNLYLFPKKIEKWKLKKFLLSIKNE